jgi:hypothetical protein
VASVDEVRSALNTLAARLSANADAQGRIDLNRTLACRVPDLATAFHGRLVDGRLVDIADGDDPKAKISLTAASDDLIELVNGRLDVMRAYTSGQVKIGANPFDLLKLRKLL